MGEMPWPPIQGVLKFNFRTPSFPKERIICPQQHNNKHTVVNNFHFIVFSDPGGPTKENPDPMDASLSATSHMMENQKNRKMKRKRPSKKVLKLNYFLCFSKRFFMTLLVHFAVKGIVQSKISRGYVKVDGLGETLLFTQTKSDKNWPL